MMVFSPETNLAYNDGSTLEPSPLESDDGWGGGSFKWHIVDGIRTNVNFWNAGLAFTGGSDDYMDTCGWRQATITFKTPVTFNRVIIWEHNCYRPDIFPDSFYIQYWDEKLKTWRNAKHVTNYRIFIAKYEAFLNYNHNKNRITVPFEIIFPEVSSKKVRYYFNNCHSSHGWINEFEVYYDKPGDRPECLFYKAELLP